MHNKGVEEDLWELPGGRMEFGETAEETLKREMLEETGLAVKPIKLLDTWSLIREDHQIAGIIYLCQFEEGEVRLSDEHDAFKWISTDEESLQMMYDDFKIRMLRIGIGMKLEGNYAYKLDKDEHQIVRKYFNFILIFRFLL